MRHFATMPVIKRCWNPPMLVWYAATIFCILFAIPARILIALLESIGWKKPHSFKRMETSLHEQLNGNLDHKGGYRAGIGQYASVWTRDSFFALFAPIPDRETRLRTFADRLRSAMTSLNHVRVSPLLYFNPHLLGNGLRVRGQ